MTPKLTTAEKSADAYRLKINGATYPEIGRKLGVCKQRAIQLVKMRASEIRDGDIMDIAKELIAGTAEKKHAGRRLMKLIDGRNHNGGI